VFSTSLTNPFIELPDAAEHFKTWWYKDDPTHLSFFCNSTLGVMAEMQDYTIDIFGDKLFVIRKGHKANTDWGRSDCQDNFSALKWYKRSAERSHKDAQNNLGALYSKREGADQDFIEALKYFIISAENGSEGGQKNINIVEKRMNHVQIIQTKKTGQRLDENESKKLNAFLGAGPTSSRLKKTTLKKLFNQLETPPFEKLTQAPILNDPKFSR